MKITKRQLRRIIKEELQSLKNESYGGIHPDDMTHGEYFVYSGGPAGMEAELDEFSVAITAARDAGVSPVDILAFVQQVLGDAQSTEVIDIQEELQKINEADMTNDPAVQELIRKAEFEVSKGRLFPGDVEAIKDMARGGYSAADIKRRKRLSF